MKRLFISLLVVSFLYSCKGYEEYVELYGEPVHITEELQDSVKDINDFLGYITPIAIQYRDPFTGEIESSIGYDRMERQSELFYDQVDIFVRRVSSLDSLNNIIKNLIYNDRELEFLMYRLMDQKLYQFEYIMAYGYLSSLTFKTPPTNNTIIQNDLVGKFKIKGTYVYLQSGNKNYGLNHILDRHTPLSYIKKKLPCKNYTNLFLQSNPNYIISLLKQAEKVKVYKGVSYVKGYVRYDVKLTCAANTSRWYSIIVEKSSKDIVTFYPTSKVDPTYLGNKFKEYKHLELKNYANNKNN